MFLNIVKSVNETNSHVTNFGKKLTVQFQNLTDCGLPRFPVGLAIRDYE